MQKSHKGLDLAGIIIIYLGSITVIINLMGIFDNNNIDDGLIYFLFFLFIISQLSLIVTFLYHVNVVKNYKIVGILGIFSSVLGGILVLVGNHESNVESNSSYMEIQLIELKSLHDKGIITKNEYEMKRKMIIEKS